MKNFWKSSTVQLVGVLFDFVKSRFILLCYFRVICFGTFNANAGEKLTLAFLIFCDTFIIPLTREMIV